MRIATLGWGSLVWNPRDLVYYGPWKNDGPEIKLEFSRISRDSRLTLVIDPENGKSCKTLYTLSPRTEIIDTVNDLLEREGTIPKRIGYYDHRHQESSIPVFRDQVDITDILVDWCETQKIDGVVWTALPPNFREEIGSLFSVERAVEFLKGLAKTTRKNALEYIRKAPDQIDTPLRRRVNLEWPINR